MGKGTISRTTFAKGLTAGVVIAASLGILQIGDYAIKMETDSETPSSGTENTVEVATTSGLAFTPGTYTASAKGIQSDITVTCTFDESGITGMEADVSGETAGIGADIGDTMIEQILAAQSTGVDGVAGATITADAVKAAVADCIAQASGNAPAADSAQNDAASGNETETNAAEDTAAPEEDGETETVSMVEESSETDAAETNDSNLSDEPADAGSTSGYTPGTYTAAAKGIQSDVTVTCTFDETSMLSMSADVSGETPGIGADIAEEIITSILTAQSSEVDGIAGATITSDAVKAAVSDCMAQASSGAGTPATPEENDSAENATEDTSAAEEAPVDETAAEITEDEAAEAAVSGSTSFTPGTYTASSRGLQSDIVVTCTFDELALTAMSADVSGETPDIGAAIGAEITGNILNAQSTEVDGIAGATVTSDAVKTAVNDCFAQAMAEYTVSDASETESVSSETAAPTAFVPGTYTSAAKGIANDVTVTCTFNENGITAISIDTTGETADIGGVIGGPMSEKILAAQSAEVDGESGATITSDAIKAAVSDCISQAAE